MLFPSLSKAAPEGPREEVAIGVIAPLTLGNAERGKEMVHTLDLLSEKLNEKSSRYRLKMIYEDGACGVGSSATTAAEKLIRVNKVKFLITGCSGETLQVGPLAERAGVLTMAVFSAHQDVKRLGEFIFRTCPDQERAAETFRDEIRCLGKKQLGLLSEENAFTQGMKTLLLGKMKESFAKVEDFPVETTDFRTILLKFRAAPLDALYFNAASPKTLGLLVKQTRDLGWQIPIFAYLHPDDPGFLRVSGEEGKGIYYLGVPDAKDVGTEFQSFITEYREKFGTSQIEALLRTTYDGLLSLSAAIEAEGPDPQKAKAFLSSFRAQGATGEISFDENGDLKNLSYVMKVVGSDGKGRVDSLCR